MRSSIPRLLVALIGCVAMSAQAALPRAIGRAFLDAGIRLDHVAIVVQDTKKLKPLFAYDGNRSRSPASVMKLVTTFAALELLGPDYRWKTEAYLDGPLVDGTLHGNLILKGYGDPKITVEQWQAFIDDLYAKGLHAIDGKLVLDRSRFALPPYDAAAFDGSPEKPYNVGPDALLVNFKSLKLTLAPDPAGAVAVHADPPLDAVALTAPRASDGACADWLATSLPSIRDRGDHADIAFLGSYPVSCGEREWWLAALDHAHYVHAIFATSFHAIGGRFDGGVAEGRVPPGALPFATLESPPLADIVRDVNKRSNNVMARQVFLALATAIAPLPATPEKATKAVARWLAARKIAVPGLVIENGSGLSRRERASAIGLNNLLIAADRSAVREEFERSLAVAAFDGTVEHRFLDAPVAGQALLKTGSLEGVRSIAGYVIDASGRRFTVVAIVNDANAARARPALDYLVQWVYENGATWDPARQR
jgi:D-alanyl-D-alanine carboxypeptidase/D-alanyl-D-alanine-endopeptidase (penicillin-binding protein 4)